MPVHSVDAPVRGAHQRRRMPGADKAHPVRHRVELAVDERGHVVLLEGAREAVQALHRGGRPGAVECVGAQRVAELAHHRRRLESVTRDVADHQAHVAVAERYRVVPVAAHVDLGGGRQVARREFHTGDVWELPRQQALLEGDDRVVLLRVQASVVHGHSRPAGEVLGEAQVLLVVAAARFRMDERERAERARARDQGHDHHRAEPDLAERPQLFRIRDRLLEHLPGDLWIQLRAARADHVGHARGRVRVEGEARAQLLREPDLLGVHVRHGGVADGAVLAHQLDPAPGGQARHREVGHLLERLLEVERLRHELARSREECEPLA